MKKRYRTITVDGIVYTWTIKNNVDGDGSNRVTVWRNRKQVIEELIAGEITPGLIEELIKKLCV